MALTCPVCGATTKGNGEPFQSPRSVEAHISASRDAEHSGKQGKDFRDEIGDGSMSDPDSPDPGDTSDSADVAPASDPVGQLSDGTPRAADGGSAAPPAATTDTADDGTATNTVVFGGEEMSQQEFLDVLANVMEDPEAFGFGTQTYVREEVSDAGIPQCIECGRYMDPVLAEDVGPGTWTVERGSLLGSGENRTVGIGEIDHVCDYFDVLYKPEKDRYIFGADSADPGAEAVPTRS